MRHVRLGSLPKIAAFVVATLPVVAQSPDGASDILRGYSNPPHHYIIKSDASPFAAIFPSKLRVAYGFNLVQGSGGGQTIAIVDAFDDPNIEADLGTFSTAFHLPACTTANGCFQKVYAAGTKPPSDTTGWASEIALDVEWSHAIAPAAKIMLVEARSNNNADLYQAVDVAVQNGANIVSMSWGGGETSNEATTDSHFNISHVIMVASSGDSGHGAQYPAASPYVVGVGGTSLTVNTSTGAYVSETAWSGSGGGASRFEPQPVYQSGFQTTGMRGVPDVAYDADPNTGVPVYNSFNCGSACPVGWAQFGGTSISAPQWAALFAIANSLRVAGGKTTLDQVNFLLYPAAEADYHDITTGSNGNRRCGAICKAGPGYDFVTGVGSPQANLLIPALVAAP
ncbi:MAG TPA: S53 family peptidase [Bryobacteraceae bacterium]|nr:S53 family peptidase [Bryobacteraceae bacterium]